MKFPGLLFEKLTTKIPHGASLGGGGRLRAICVGSNHSQTSPHYADQIWSRSVGRVKTGNTDRQNRHTQRDAPDLYSTVTNKINKHR